MKYKINTWVAWNGGKCPVHPETIVEILEPVVDRFEGPAHKIHWKHLRGAFRVIREHVEPREVWMRKGILSGEWHMCREGADGAVLFREVQP